VAISVDASAWPVVRVTWDGLQSDAELERYFAETRACLERRQPYVTITWMKNFHNKAEHRQKMAAFMKDTDEANRRYNLAAGIISTSAIFRFALSMVMLIRPIPVPFKVCGSFPEALAFVREKARTLGLLLPLDVPPME
jgi:hypothetical protein